MNPVTQSLIRTVLKAGGGYLIAQGMIDQSTAETAAAAALTLIGVVWGVMQRKSQSALASPRVKVIKP